MDHHPKPANPANSKREMHPRNRHRGAYDFAQLSQREPALTAFVARNDYGNLAIDFANPAAVKTLNRALLREFYGVHHWDIPAHYLCPPIPGRADYLHYLADLLALSNGGEIRRGDRVHVLDVGVGANMVYPLIGHYEYGWQFVGADIDARALANAEQIIDANPHLRSMIRLRRQQNPEHIFTGLIQADERFDLTLCNPPFHRSLAEAQAGTERKLRGLAHSAGTATHASKRVRGQPSSGKPSQPALNFGGQASELFCPGGETAFIKRMITQSEQFPDQVRWFTTLVSKAENLSAIYRALQQTGVQSHKTVAMAQGQKQSRFVAWTFLNEQQQRDWQQR